MTSLHVLPRRPTRLIATILILIATSAQRSGSSDETDQIFEGLKLREGATVCEIGAGSGSLSIAAARRVGADGLVYTSELGEERVKELQASINASGLKQIKVVSGDPNKTNFPEFGCDALFMRNVYHHFADPAAMDASIFASVKPGGRVAIADFTPEGAEAARPADRSKTGSSHGVLPESVSRELQAAGFEDVSFWHDPSTSNSSGERWFIVFVAKPRP